MEVTEGAFSTSGGGSVCLKSAISTGSKAWNEPLGVWGLYQGIVEHEYGLFLSHARQKEDISNGFSLHEVKED
jgi:hypothetical protein